MKKFSEIELSKHVGSVSQVAGATKMMVDEGKGKGMTIIRVRNGNGLDFTLLPDRGLDVFDVHFEGVQLAWISRNGLVAHSFFDDKGMGWLRSFGGGMLTTCGLRNVGPPEDDNGEHFGLHGRVSGLPATHVSIKEYWEKDIFYVEVGGQIHETNMFGENLILDRTYKVNSQSNEINIHDKISNRGFRKEQLMLLYHLNWGYPLLDDSSELSLNPASVLIRGDDQSEVALWNRFQPPTGGYEERVYFFDLIPDENNLIGYKLFNKGIGKGVKVTWNKNSLPHLTEWKMMGEGDYVLGLEPGNVLPIGRKASREQGNVEYLDSFEEKEVHLKIQFLNF